MQDFVISDDASGFDQVPVDTTTGAGDGNNNGSDAFVASSNRSTSSWSKNSDVETASSRSQVSGSEHASEHDQLPSVEEIRMNAPNSNRSSGKRGKVALCVIAALVVVAAIVVAITVVITKNGATDKDFPMNGAFTSQEGSTFDEPVRPDTAAVTTFPPVATATITTAPKETTTAAPVVTPAPESRQGKLVDMLATGGISPMEDMLTEDSPQNKAVKWLANEDTLALDMDSPDMAAIKQRFSIVTTYYSVGGEQWPNRLNFLNGNHECLWFVKAFAGDQKTIRQYGITCNDDNTVKGLHFPSNFLKGSFPTETRNLDNLEKFEAFNNPGLTNGFPGFFQALSKISYIGLHYCGLTGSIPSWIGSKTTLTALVLSNNDFTGPLPANLNQLKSLEDLYLDDNQLSGSITMLEGLTSMRNMVLEDNTFEGSFTQDMVSSWAQLETFDASHNLLTGALPAAFFTLPKLRVLDLHGNQFTGALPTFTIGDETRLEILTLNENQLDSEIPYELGQCSNLKHLDMTGNKLASTIPASFVHLTNLEFLYMARNEFSEGEIPAFLSVMTSLTELSLKGTARTGTIPSIIGNLKSLALLDLDDNKLKGTIPSSIGGLPDLRYLLLNRNELTGSIPSSLSALSNLAFFMIEKNSLNGSAEGVCGFEDVQQVFIADCAGSTPEVECPCCTQCCSDGVGTCNDQVWLGDSNPIWELGYVRQGPVEFDAAASRSYTVQFSGAIPP